MNIGEKEREDKTSLWENKKEQSDKTRIYPSPKYSSPIDRAVDKSTITGRRIWQSPIDDGYKDYLKN